MSTIRLPDGRIELRAPGMTAVVTVWRLFELAEALSGPDDGGGAAMVLPFRSCA